MSNHYVSINKGKDGLKKSDFTTGTSSTSSDDIELRVADATALSRLDVIKALKAFENYFTTATNAQFPAGT